MPPHRKYLIIFRIDVFGMGQVSVLSIKWYEIMVEANVVVEHVLDQYRCSYEPNRYLIFSSSKVAVDIISILNACRDLEIHTTKFSRYTIEGRI